MEVIFDTTNLRPVLSPTMRTTLSVISLIANSLIEANKCMKERLADEAAPPTTLDQVMQQSGLKIPGLEEALARLMGSGTDAKQAASMIVSTPDPVKLLQTFAAQYGFAPTSAGPPAPSPIVTPPPAANTPPSFTVPAPSAPAAAAPGPRLAPFRVDFTREAREAAKAAAASPSSPGLPQFRQDFAPEGRQAPQVRNAGPVQRSAPASEAEQLSLVGGVARQLGTIRRHRQGFEGIVHNRLVNIETGLAKLRDEFDQLHAEFLDAASKSDKVASATSAVTPDNVVDPGVAATPATEQIVPAPNTAAVSSGDGVAAAPATVPQTEVADTGTPAHTVAEQPAYAPTVDTLADEPLPAAATAEEVVQAIGMIEEFAVETQVAEEAQLNRITAAEQEIARMRALIQSVREARGAAQAHV